MRSLIGVRSLLWVLLFLVPVSVLSSERPSKLVSQMIKIGSYLDKSIHKVEQTWYAGSKYSLSDACENNVFTEEQLLEDGLLESASCSDHGVITLTIGSSDRNLSVIQGVQFQLSPLHIPDDPSQGKLVLTREQDEDSLIDPALITIDDWGCEISFHPHNFQYYLSPGSNVQIDAFAKADLTRQEKWQSSQGLSAQYRGALSKFCNNKAEPELEE